METVQAFLLVIILLQCLHYLYRNADIPKNILTMILTDFSKAFDRIDHNILIRKLVWLNVRPCVISLIVDFLHHRQQVVKYKGCISDVKNKQCRGSPRDQTWACSLPDYD